MKRLLFLIHILLLCAATPGWSGYRIFTDIPADSAYTDSIVRLTFTRLQVLLSPFTYDSLDIFVVTSEKSFDSLAGNSVPDWGAGVALPYRNRIVIKSPLIMSGEKSLGELVAHELTHIVLVNRVRFQPLPRWLHEGMAMYFSAEWGWGDNLAVARAVVFDGTIALSSIENMNRFSGNKAQIAYSESYLAVKYFLDNYGQSSLRILLDEVQKGRDIDEAFIAATGGDHGVFQQEYDAFLKTRYNVMTLIVDSNLLWIILSLVVILGFVIVRLTRKKRLRKLDEREKYHSTVFDYGEIEKPDEDDPLV